MQSTHHYDDVGLSNCFFLGTKFQKNGLRRSDNSYHNASNLEDVSAEDERELPTHQYYNDDGNDVTTDGGEEYFMHDTESVDRLAMDGETREPFNTSTLAIDGNYY